MQSKYPVPIQPKTCQMLPTFCKICKILQDSGLERRFLLLDENVGVIPPGAPELFGECPHRGNSHYADMYSQ